MLTSSDVEKEQIKFLAYFCLHFEVIFVVQNRDQLIFRGRGGSVERRFLQHKKGRCGNAASQCVCVCVGERDRQSVTANLVGGIAEIDRRCSGAGGAGDDVGHLDRTLQSDGTTKCWGIFGRWGRGLFLTSISKKNQVIAHLLSRPHGATFFSSLQEGFCNLEVDEDSGRGEKA